MYERHSYLESEPTRDDRSCCQDADREIELPPIPELTSFDTADPSHAAQRFGGWKRLLGGVVVAGGVLVGGLGLLSDSSDESEHPNWQHVATATEASTDGSSHLVHVGADGSSQTIRTLELTSADADRAATWRVRTALLRKDLAGATAALQAAQKFPSASDADVAQPDLAANPDLATALTDGRQELFQIELFDCCQEDGDVVDVLVNGSQFSTVPVTKAGTLLSIPLSSGSNTITVVGARDGRGGVTLSLRTSRGDFIARRMHVGEAYEIGVVVQ